LVPSCAGRALWGNGAGGGVPPLCGTGVVRTGLSGRCRVVQPGGVTAGRGTALSSQPRLCPEPNVSDTSVVTGGTRRLVLQLYFWACPPFVVPILGDALMPAAPCRPGQNPFHFLLRGQHKTPEETTNLADTQRHASPRVALNVAKLLGVGG